MHHHRSPPFQRVFAVPATDLLLRQIKGIRQRTEHSKPSLRLIESWSLGEFRMNA